MILTKKFFGYGSRRIPIEITGFCVEEKEQTRAEADPCAMTKKGAKTETRIQRQTARRF
jgi:hypothetical protein